MAVTTGAAAVAATSTRGAAARTGLRKLRGVNLIDGCLEFLARGGEVLEEFDFVIEMDEEGFVFVFTENVVEEGAAGGALLIEDAALAEAGVDEEAEGEREIGFFGEIGDGLGLGVLFEGEVFLREIADQAAVFVANGGEEIYGGDVNGDGRLLGGQKDGEEKSEKDCRKFPHFRGDAFRESLDANVYSRMTGQKFPGEAGKKN